MALEDLLTNMAVARENIANWTEEKAQIEEAIIKEMEAAGLTTITANSGDLKGTLVKGSRVTVDEATLKGILSPAQWKKVTKTVLDKEKLEAAIVIKEVDAQDVAAASAEKDVKPYVKVSGTFRTNKKAAAAAPAVNTKNSKGGTKPAAKKRVVKPKK